jgi:hypothetical protein
VNIGVGIVTVDRPENYLQATMRSLEESGFFNAADRPPLTLFVGQPDASYVERYKDKALIDWPSKAELESLKYASMHAKARCGYGHFRAMRGLSERDVDAALILEDDVVFSKDWWPYAKALLPKVARSARAAKSTVHPGHDVVGCMVDGKELPELSGAWVLQLYRLVKDVAGRGADSKTWFRFQNWTCFGTQANVYSKSVLSDLYSFVLKNVVMDYQCPIDAAVIWHSKMNAVPTYASVPSIVQHIGRGSTGQTDYFHEAEYFFEEIPEMFRSRAIRKE